MAELLIRVGAQDASFIESVLVGPKARRPSRLVVDAHVAAQGDSRIQHAARSAGVPLLIDPQTFLLQDVQHPGDRWASLPFAEPSLLTPADFAHGTAARIAEAVIDYQIAHGATVIVLPYVHIEQNDDGWSAVQRSLWRTAATYLRQTRTHLPVLAVLALGWRMLGAGNSSAVTQTVQVLSSLQQPTEIALAASRVDEGVHPERRLAAMASTIENLSLLAPVIAWQQGALGEAAVAAGAIGYECGIGWRERCDLKSTMAQHRKPTDFYGRRPVYISALGRSIPRQSVEAFLQNPRLAAELTCPDVTCCPHGRDSLVSNSRQHTITARKAALDSLTEPALTAWRWQVLTAETARRLDLATRLNHYVERTGQGKPIKPATLTATQTIASAKRETTRGRSVA